MSFAVVHMQKISRGGLRGIQSHNQREKESRSNPDIDYSLSKHNYDVFTSDRQNYNRRVSEIIELGRKDNGRAVRKDAVVMCNFIVTSDKAFFDNLPEPTKNDFGAWEDKQSQFFEDSWAWFANRYGVENIVNATVHLDEKTPHMHLGVVPITDDGRLSAKDLFNRKEMTAIQTEFARDVGEKYGLQRGVEGSDRTHLSEMRFKAVTAAAELEKAQKGMEALTEEKNAVQGQIGALQGQMERHQTEATTAAREAERTRADMERTRHQLRAEQDTLGAVRMKLDEAGRIKPQKTITGAVKGVTVEQVKDLQNMGVKYLVLSDKYRELQEQYNRLYKTHEDLKGRVPSMTERIAEAREKSRLLEVEKAFKRLPAEVREQLMPSRAQGKDRGRER